MYFYRDGNDLHYRLSDESNGEYGSGNLRGDGQLSGSDDDRNLRHGDVYAGFRFVFPERRDDGELFCVRWPKLLVHGDCQ